MDYMAQTLALARLALGQASPNPAVGAVVVRAGRIVGQGYTQPPGGDHAEVVALKQAGELARGASLYVSLEPCCHHGRTPPCTGAIIKSGITEVHAATLDDNPLVAGGGRQALEAAGIRVSIGEGEAEARVLNEAYFKFICMGIPFVTAKYAMSLDGKIATRSGDSKWISSEPSRQYVHNMRYVSDAVMVGVNTVISDDPHLTARTGCGRGGPAHRQPLRVIVDDKGRMPPGARLFKEPGKTLIALGSKPAPPVREALTRAGAELVELPTSSGLVDIAGLLNYLGQRQVTSVLVEGGGTLLGSLFDQGLVDKVIAFVAPIVIGGKAARTPVAGLGVERIAAALKLERLEVNRLQDDVMISAYVSKA